MKPVTTRSLLLMCAVLACAPAVAQDTSDTSSAAHALDLSVPATRIDFPTTSDSRNEPPGTWVGDMSSQRALEGNANGDWQVHGSMEMGVGWSERGGNSNWQAATINMGKAYTTDDGDTGHMGLNISVGQFDGPAFGPERYYGPEAGPMRVGPGPFGREMMPGPAPVRHD